MSRADIARELGLSPAAVSQIMRRLLEQRMVEEVAQAPSSGGRPGSLIGLVGEAGRALGVKVAADHLVIVNVRLDGQMLSSTTLAFDAMAPDALTRLATELAPHTHLDPGLPKLLGVGVAVPGVVPRPDKGIVDADVLQWRRLPVGRHLRGALGLPVVVENDVNALAVAEVLYGHGREADDFLVLTIGRGIGLSIVADRSVYRGGKGGAGEFGHVPMDDQGPLCQCGRHGCLEAWLGEPALERIARAGGVIGPRQGFAALVAAADRGDGHAVEIFADAGRLLGRAVAGAANMLDPARIVLAGEGVAHWIHWDATFRAEFARRQVRGGDGIDVVVHNWDDSSWAQGAAALVLAAPFDLDGFGGEQANLVVARLHGADGADGTVE
ncbi:ROK family transcriptional regulator [Dactylosporangium sp. AC04546]|uniref:ROK family protein n=1 Tax=Dactylosporangium sp. AC04546 TaxID=2862460 RepID=UPI001EDEEEA0|nr:ROK family transcriptional regulator [Dactylosporangium sp. AC04546]WVK80950.1 ROK family transcriptional regulator [Dactylosporangium sp. AC04546]